jgi:glucosyl-3-phosphoglycerate phosphatase
MWPGGDGPDMVRLVLWRHGQTDYNIERRFQGQQDVPLNELGRQQAAQTAPYLAALRPAAIFSSDLSRASVTADALARLTGLPVQLDKDLRERSGGAWENLTESQIRARFPEGFATSTPEGGEPISAVADRTSAALIRAADSVAPGSLAVVVGHGASLSLAVTRLLGLPEGLRPLGPFGNCRWSVISRRGSRWRLLEHNVGILTPPVPAAAVAAVAAAPDDDK